MYRCANLKSKLRLMLLLVVAAPLVLSPSSLEGQSENGGVELLTSDDVFVEGEQIKEGIRLIGFEKNEDGSKTGRITELSSCDQFAFAGVKLTCPNAEEGVDLNGVMVAGYKFKNSISGDRCIATKIVRKGRKWAYRSSMRIDFCSPDGNAQTVSKMGLRLEITRPRQTVLQAYNSSGHRIAICEATKTHTSFVGFESERPIAYVVAQGNTFLGLIKPNLDYAIDDIMLGTADSDSLRNLGDKATGALATGNYLQPFRKDLYSDIERPSDSVSVMLECGSVLNCRVADGKLMMIANPNVNVPVEKVIGVWGCNNECRYPLDSDFEDPSKAVLVTALYRVCTQAKVDLAENVAVLDMSDLNAQFQLWETNKENYNELKTNRDIEIGLANLGIKGDGKMALSASHSLWFKVPPARSKFGKILRTRDGQEFVLGGESPFAFAEIKGDKVMLTYQGESAATVAIDAGQVDVFVRE